MHRRRARATSNALLLALLVCTAALSGCATTSAYGDFAAIGQRYSTALDETLVEAGGVALDATSWRMLQDDQLSNTSAADYERLSDIDKARLKLLGKLRQHGRLLAAWFNNLAAIAGSDASETAAASAAAIAETAITLGNELAESNVPLVGEFVAGISKTIIDAAAAKALKTELTKHADAMREQIALQGRLLEAVADDLEDELATALELREQFTVLQRLTADEAIPSHETVDWVKTRREVLQSARSIEQIRTARSALSGLERTFEKLVSGKMDPGELARAGLGVGQAEAMLETADEDAQ